MNPYKFMGETYVEVAELTKALALNWNEGKKQLFRGILSGFFKGCNRSNCRWCSTLCIKGNRNSGYRVRSYHNDILLIYVV